MNNVDLSAFKYVLNGLSTHEKIFQLKVFSGGKENYFQQNPIATNLE